MVFKTIENFISMVHVRGIQKKKKTEKLGHALIYHIIRQNMFIHIVSYIVVYTLITVRRP